MKEKLKNNKGITLIALVVTIVVLLILAGVSINLVVGNNGIINKAKDAKKATNRESLKEEASMAVANRNIDKPTDKLKDLDVYLREQIKESEVVRAVEYTENGIYNDACYVTKNGVTITVYPDGKIEDEKINIWDGKTIKKPVNGWVITNAEELKYFADFVNGKIPIEEQDPKLVITEATVVKLMNNIDLGARQENGILVSGTKWDGIGDNKFLGTFEGNNHFIKGVYINQDKIDSKTQKLEIWTGLFRKANKIQNLTIKDSYVEGGLFTGGIVGDADTIINCHNDNTTVVGKEGNYGYGEYGYIGRNNWKNKSFYRKLYKYWKCVRQRSR